MIASHKQLKRFQKAENIDMNKNSIIKGTLILTIAGFSTRFIGFFYRIYLSKMLGAENMGVYQLIFAVYGVCFTIYASGIQTSISSLVAAEVGRKNTKNTLKILKIGMFFSFCIALFLSFLVYNGSEYIAYRFLSEPRCAPSLRVLAIVFPFCGMTSCINGYYYGLKKAGIPATTQLIEQIIRVLTVYMIATYVGKGNMEITCELAIFGVVLGEIGSDLFNLFSLFFERKPKLENTLLLRKRTIIHRLLKLSIPLTSNRLLISILSSFEAVLIPTMLRKSGLSVSESLSIYGVLTGMSIPFIMFPSAITNSLAVMLLPTISEAQALNNDLLINKTASISIKFSIIIGILSTGIFIIFGEPLGIVIFNNKSSGTFLMILSWLCPFMYLTTTLGSIINGLGKTHITFFNTVIGISIRILFVIILIPKYGISSYLISLLVSQLIISFLDVLAIIRNATIDFNAYNSILKPSLCMLFIGFLSLRTYQYLSKITVIQPLILLLISCFVLCIGYFAMLFITKSLNKREFAKGK